MRESCSEGVDEGPGNVSVGKISVDDDVVEVIIAYLIADDPAFLPCSKLVILTSNAPCTVCVGNIIDLQVLMKVLFYEQCLGVA